MPLFRHHRGGLADSLKTTIIVKDIRDLLDKIIKDFDRNWYIFNPKEIIIKIDEDEVFDARCGWYSHYVLVKGLYDDKFQCVGYVSEPLDDNIDCVNLDLLSF